MVARAHKTLVWERTRAVQRLRNQLRDYFPAALEAFADLDAPDTLELLAKAPDPASAARLTTAQIDAALKRARRRDRAGKTAAIKTALRGQQLGQPPAVTAACAAVARSLAALITTLNQQVRVLEGHLPRTTARSLRSEDGRPGFCGRKAFWSVVFCADVYRLSSLLTLVWLGRVGA